MPNLSDAELIRCWTYQIPNLSDTELIRFWIFKKNCRKLCLKWSPASSVNHQLADRNMYKELWGMCTTSSRNSPVRVRLLKQGGGCEGHSFCSNPLELHRAAEAGPISIVVSFVLTNFSPLSIYFRNRVQQQQKYKEKLWSIQTLNSLPRSKQTQVLKITKLYSIAHCHTLRKKPHN